MTDQPIEQDNTEDQPGQGGAPSQTPGDSQPGQTPGSPATGGKGSAGFGTAD
ncbi:MAG: hypothetical protein ACI8U3_002566 [Brevundimonas sp.]|jgi:hypothetical protein|uniref:hypothetical protein n=1 Tax=Brevundimonas sp. TaxID=1871086 RepID=UPI0039E54C83